MHAILCAIPEELAALRQQLHVHDRPSRHGAMHVWTGEHGGRPVALALAGLGKVNAAAGAAVLLDRYEASALIFSGVAGGLNPAFGVGSVLLGEKLAIHDFGLIADRAFVPTLSGINPIGAPRLEAANSVSDEVRATLARLRDAVAPRLDASVALGSLTTADYFLNCAATRDDLHAALGVDAIDMESGAVAQVAAAWGAPLYVIRTLSDQAGDDSHLSFTQMAEMAARNSALCVTALLELLD